MDKSELLAELDTYFAARDSPTQKRSLGSDINVYQVRGAIVRLNDKAEEHDIVFYVYKEGTGPTERAYYNGDPINFFWSLKVIDYITITNEWSGRIFFRSEPKAICRVLQDPAVGEKWVLIEETAPDTYSVTDIVGNIFTDI